MTKYQHLGVSYTHPIPKGDFASIDQIPDMRKLKKAELPTDREVMASEDTVPFTNVYTDYTGNDPQMLYHLRQTTLCHVLYTSQKIGEKKKRHYSIAPVIETEDGFCGMSVPKKDITNLFVYEPK
jgi:hypothetical protein